MSESSEKKLRPRDWLLGGALALTLAATMWAAQTSGDDDEAAVQPTAGERRARPDPAARAETPAAPPSDWNLPLRHEWSVVTPPQLAAWAPPPPPPPPPAPPPPKPVAAAPMAPAFPYQLIGRMDEQVDGKPVTVAFLSGPLHSLGVRAGDVVDGQWRVDQIGPGGVTLTWLPQQLKQTIALRPGSSS